jgi:hypothetical protein
LNLALDVSRIAASTSFLSQRLNFFLDELILRFRT